MRQGQASYGLDMIVERRAGLVAESLFLDRFLTLCCDLPHQDHA
jgi:hypothetical protein